MYKALLISLYLLEYVYMYEMKRMKFYGRNIIPPSLNFLFYWSFLAWPDAAAWQMISSWFSSCAPKDEI